MTKKSSITFIINTSKCVVYLYNENVKLAFKIDYSNIKDVKVEIKDVISMSNLLNLSNFPSDECVVLTHTAIKWAMHVVSLLNDNNGLLFIHELTVVVPMLPKFKFYFKDTQEYMTALTRILLESNKDNTLLSVAPEAITEELTKRVMKDLEPVSDDGEIYVPLDEDDE